MAQICFTAHGSSYLSELHETHVHLGAHEFKLSAGAHEDVAADAFSSAIRAVHDIDLCSPVCRQLTWLLITVGGGADSKAAHA